MSGIVDQYGRPFAPAPTVPTVWRGDGYLSAVAGDRYGAASSVVNRSTGFGIPGLDGGAANQALTKLRGDAELTWLYLGSGLAARIIDKPADDTLARGFEVEGDDDDHTIEGECERLNVNIRVADAIRWARLFGGAAILIVADDGGTLEDPLNEARLASVRDLKVYDASAISVDPADVTYDDPLAANFGLPEFYLLTPFNGGEQFRVHDTRLIFVCGEVLPSPLARQRGSALWWRGRSVLEGCYDSVVRYSAGLQWSERMMERKQQAVYSMIGLTAMIQSGREELAKRRVGMVDVTRGVLNTVVIDGGDGVNATAGDKYEVRDLNLNGVTDMLNHYQVSISADTGIAVTVLFGRSPAGMNSTGEGDFEGYYGLIERIRSNQAQPALKRLVTLILAQREFSGAKPAEWEIEFAPLWIPSDKEQAETALGNAQADKASAEAADVYMASGVMTNVDVRADLVAANKYGLTGTVALVDNTAVVPPDGPGGPNAPPAQA